MAFALKSLEHLTAIGCGLAAAAVGALDAGLAAGAAIGIAALTSQFREGCARHGLDEADLMGKMQLALLRKWDRHDLSQADRDIITLADAAMTAHLPSCMLTRHELAQISISAGESYPQRVSRLITNQLALRDTMFAVPTERDGLESLARRFARDTIESALAVVREDKDYAILLTVDLLMAGNQAHAVTHNKLDDILAAVLAARPSPAVSDDTLFEISRRVSKTIDDIDDAVRQIHAAVDELLELRERAKHQTNLSDQIDDALRSMAERNNRNQFDDAAEVGEKAWVALAERQKAELLALSDMMITQSRIRTDAKALARWTEQQLRIDHPVLSATQLFAAIDRHRGNAQTQGLVLEQDVAILLADRALTLAQTDWELGAAQDYRGLTASEQGERIGGEAGSALLDRAIAAFKAALKIRTRNLVPTDWAMTQNNLGRVDKRLQP
jgi:hypothetical protein